MPSPLPLTVHPNSHLVGPLGPIEWAFEERFNLQLGQDGVGWTETMQINWSDLQNVVVALLGYSRRDPSTIPTLGVSQLRRKLPWQHPYFNQLWVKNVTNVEGIGPRGNSDSNGAVIFGNAGGVGAGHDVNMGPWSEFERARLSVQFWRPPYFVRSDQDIEDVVGVQQEWLRFVDKKWTHNAQILTREGSTLEWSGGTSTTIVAGPAPRPLGLPGSVGQVVQHQRISRTWYEIPEEAVFSTAQDGFTPNGDATNLMYSQAEAYNPITGYLYTGGYPILSAVNLPIGGGYSSLLSCTRTAGSATVTTADTSNVNVGDAVFGTGIRTGSYVVSKVLNTSFTMNLAATASGSSNLRFVTDTVVADRLFGAVMGTLRFDLAEINYRPLQLPPYLMQIPTFAQNEAISQQQLDVTLHFDRFDPPRGTGFNARGHNLMPSPDNNLWYPINSQKGDDGLTTSARLTPFPYADLSKLFQIL